MDPMLWLGDFNRHHPMWEEDANSHLFESENDIAPLLHLLYRHNMLLALPKGIPTFQTSTGRWTHLDNIWHTNMQVDPIQRCDVIPNILPPLADHMPIITVINLPLPRVVSQVTLNYRAVDWLTINEVLDERL